MVLYSICHLAGGASRLFLTALHMNVKIGMIALGTIIVLIILIAIIMLISGSGNMLGYGLATRRSFVTKTGSSQAEVNTKDRLDGRLIGNVRTLHIGAPSKINQQVSGSASLTKFG